MNGEIISKFRKIRHCSSLVCFSSMYAYMSCPISNEFFFIPNYQFLFFLYNFMIPQALNIVYWLLKKLCTFFLYFIFTNLMNESQKNICVVWQDFWGDYLFLFITSPSPKFFIYFYYQSIKGMLQCYLLLEHKIYIGKLLQIDKLVGLYVCVIYVWNSIC